MLQTLNQLYKNRIDKFDESKHMRDEHGRFASDGSNTPTSKEWIRDSKKRIVEIDNQLKNNPPDADKLKNERYVLNLNVAYLKKDQTTVLQAKKDYAKIISDSIKYKIQQMPKGSAPIPIEMYGRKVAHTNLFQVPSSLQGKGIGSLALQEFENKVRSEGADSIALSQVLPEAQKFYKQNGYSILEGDIAFKDLKLSQPTGEGKVGEKIVSSVIEINGKQFEAPLHSQAINIAKEEGVLFENEKGVWVDKNGKPVIWNTDLFRTSTGRIIDRFTADRLFNVTAGENISRTNILPQPTGDGTVIRL